MKQVTVTIPDEYYENLVQFLKPIPDSNIDNSQDEYNKSVEKMVLDRIKNSKSEDYTPWNEAKKRLDAKWLK